MSDLEEKEKGQLSDLAQAQRKRTASEADPAGPKKFRLAEPRLLAGEPILTVDKKAEISALAKDVDKKADICSPGADSCNGGTGSPEKSSKKETEAFKDIQKPSKGGENKEKVSKEEEKKPETKETQEDQGKESKSFYVPGTSKTSGNLIIENNNHVPMPSINPGNKVDGGNLFMNAAKQFSSSTGFGGSGFGSFGGGFAAAAKVEKKGFGYVEEKSKKSSGEEADKKADKSGEGKGSKVGEKDEQNGAKQDSSAIFKSSKDSCVFGSSEKSEPSEAFLQKGPVLTGEEDEKVAHVGTAKFFVLDKEKKVWKEIGAGNLRVLDSVNKETGQRSSRIVGRMSGSMRLIINVKIWGNMDIAKMSPKTIRFTAIEADKSFNSYLISTAVQDQNNLYELLTKRVSEMKKAQESS
eukprot:Nk52_evm36s1737 gene=Nk52_evmTU36s1737